MRAISAITRRIKGKLRARRELSAVNAQRWTVPTGRPHLSYAGMSTKKRAGVIHGGQIKLLHLAKHYPERANTANLLYLVSSALPPHALTLINNARAQGVKFVLNQNGVAYPAWAGKETTSINDALRAVQNLADFVIYQSDYAQASSEKFLGKVNVATAVIPNCVDVDVYRPKHRSSSTNNQECNLLVLGTQNQPNRVVTAIETLLELKQQGFAPTLTVAGRLDWPEAPAPIDDLINQHKLRKAVQFVGAFSQDEAPNLYQSATVLLHMQYKDVCPSVVLEAMACGLPIVATRTGGIPQLLGEKYLGLIDIEDNWDKMLSPQPNEVAQQVVKCLNDHAGLSKTLRQRAVKHFAIGRWLDVHGEIFANLIK